MDRGWMPKNVAQWTGLTVTAIIGLGCDRDVIWALPIGIMAGVLASLLATLDERCLAISPVRIRIR
ncbi:MAG TPA: hypothetical protein VHU18_13890 [Rhizomicrobium sp.]|jgi:hypothetical protein|nr:hypothetical protein [Rhizomicrobium sp.]